MRASSSRLASGSRTCSRTPQLRTASNAASSYGSRTGSPGGEAGGGGGGGGAGAEGVEAKAGTQEQVGDLPHPAAPVEDRPGRVVDDAGDDRAVLEQLRRRAQVNVCAAGHRAATGHAGSCERAPPGTSA